MLFNNIQLNVKIFTHKSLLFQKKVVSLHQEIKQTTINNMDNKTIIAYKQGNQWVLNINGYMKHLPYFIKSKKNVKQWLENWQNEHDYEGYTIEFDE